jgi:hypothetical protein
MGTGEKMRGTSARVFSSAIAHWMAVKHFSLRKEKRLIYILELPEIRFQQTYHQLTVSELSRQQTQRQNTLPPRKWIDI